MRSRIPPALFLLTLLVLLAGACSDLPPPTATAFDQPAFLNGISANLTMSTDSIYWDSAGVLEMTDDQGNILRYERQGPEENPTSVRVYLNDAFKGSISFSWSGTDISSSTIYPAGSSEWITIAGDGTLIETSWRLDPCDSGGGPRDGDPGGDGGIEEPGEGDPCDEMNLVPGMGGISLMSIGDEGNGEEDLCKTDREQFHRSAGYFGGSVVGGGIFVWLGRRALERIWPPAAVASGVLMVKAIVDGGFWAHCEMMK